MIIPLLQGGDAIGNAPAPALDRRQRPTVNMGGVVNATAALGQAAAMPMDKTDVAAPSRALGAVADAVIQAGSVIGALGHKRAQERERLAMIEAEGEIDVASESLASFFSQHETNTGAWRPQAEKVTAEVAKRVLANDKLGRHGREALTLKLNTWGKTTVMQAETAGAKQDFQLSRKGQLRRIEVMTKRRDFTGAAAALEEARGSGVFHDIELDGVATNITDAEASASVQGWDAEASHQLAQGTPEGLAAARAVWANASAPEGVAAKAFGDFRRAKLDEVELKHAVRVDEDQLQADVLANPGGAVKDFANRYPAIKGNDRVQAMARLREGVERVATDATMEARRAAMLLPADKLQGATVEALGIDATKLTPFHRHVVEMELETLRTKSPEGLQAQAARHEAAFAALWAVAGVPPQGANEMEVVLTQGRFELLASTLPRELESKLLAKREEIMKPDADGVALAVGDAVAFAHEAMASVPETDPATGAPLLSQKPQRYIAYSGEVKSFLGIDWLWPDVAPTHKEQDKPGFGAVHKPIEPGKVRLLTVAEKELTKWMKTPEAKGKSARGKLIEIMRGLGVTDLTSSAEQTEPDNTLVGDQSRFEELTQ